MILFFLPRNPCLWTKSLRLSRGQWLMVVFNLEQILALVSMFENISKYCPLWMTINKTLTAWWWPLLLKPEGGERVIESCYLFCDFTVCVKVQIQKYISCVRQCVQFVQSAWLSGKAKSATKANAWQKFDKVGKYQNPLFSICMK